jgi:hypothetical protein
MPFGDISQGVLLTMASVMIIPSLMPFLSLALPTGVNRWLNIVVGILYSMIMFLAIRVALLYPFRIDRSYAHGTYRLVRLDVAEAANLVVVGAGRQNASGGGPDLAQNRDGAILKLGGGDYC